VVIVALEEPTVSVPWTENSGLWTREGDEISGSSDGAVNNCLDIFREVYIVTSSAVFTGDFLEGVIAEESYHIPRQTCHLHITLVSSTHQV